MTPLMNRSLTPLFSEIGEKKFQVLCADLLAEDQIYLNPLPYGRSGQGQKGIDIEAPLRDGTGLHVGQCKAWTEPSAEKIREATTDFEPHADYWRQRGLKRYILLIGCAVADTKSQDQLHAEKLKFQELGFEYEWWDAQILRRKLRPFEHIVRNHCEPADYWVEFICGKAASTLDAKVAAGAELIFARLGTLVLELSDSRNAELNAIRELWEEGSVEQALHRVRVMSQTDAWEQLTAQVRAKALRIQAGLTLAANEDVLEARRLLERAKSLDPEHSMALEANVVRHEVGILAALEVVKAPANLDAWKVRFGLLLELGEPEKVLQELPLVPAEAARTLETAWLEGMSLLSLKRAQEAEKVISAALKRRPRSFALRMAMAIVRYASGISTAFSSWGHLTWPIPPPWYLVKRDEASRQQRAIAADEFANLAEHLEGEARREVLIWRLACLANDTSTQNEAAIFCDGLLNEAPTFVPALMWASFRGFEFNVSVSIAALQERLKAPKVDLEEVIALFAILADTQGIEAAEALLDARRADFEREDRLYFWRGHKVQLLVHRGDDVLALKLADEETNPQRRRQVRQMAQNAIGRKRGTGSAGGLQDEAEFGASGDAEELFSSCIARRALGDWKFVADHAIAIVTLIGTDAALRLGAEGAVNARCPELALKLLNDNVALCPGGLLPPDLERLRAEALKQQGHLGKAVEAAAKAANMSPNIATLVQLFRLQQAKGDMLGTAETAKLILKLPEVPAQFLTQEVAPAIRRVAPELAREVILKVKQSLPTDSPALLLLAQQASKAGLTQIAQEIFGTLPATLADKGVAGIQPVDSTRLAELFRAQAQSWTDAIQEYRRGRIPVHVLSFHFNLVLARWFIESPRDNARDGFPIRGFPLLTRHASLANDQPVLDNQSQLFLDVTSVLLLRALDLLDKIDSAFTQIVLPARLTKWIQAEIDILQAEQPDRVAARAHALQMSDGGSLQPWVGDPAFSAPTTAWAQRMGGVWCERLARAQSKGGVLVDFLPLRANQPEMELVTIPESETRYVVAIDDIIASLEAGAYISAAQAAQARQAITGQTSTVRTPRTIHLHAGLEVHLESAIAEELALANVLEPLTKTASVFVSASEVSQWRATHIRLQSDTKLISELENLLAHISKRFDSAHYRGHECPSPHTPPNYQRPLSEQELCFQDTFDFAANGSGIWCADDRFLRSLRRGKNQPSVDTFDLIHHLHQKGKLNDDEYYDALLKLRAGNIRYLPLREQELIHHLFKAQVENGEVTDTPALTVLRRSVAASLLDAEWLQRPIATPEAQPVLLESEFPARLYLSLCHAMVEIWRDKQSTLVQRAARAQWLWKNLSFDIRLVQQLFAHPGGPMSATDAVGHSLGHLFGQGIVIPGGRQDGLRADYFRWLFDGCVAPYLINSPDVLKAIGVTLRRIIEDSLQAMDACERSLGKMSNEYRGHAFLMGGFIVDLPPAINAELRLSEAELSRFGLRSSRSSLEILGVGLEPTEFWPAVARAFEKGYAAILKEGTRLQIRRIEADNRLRIVRKGEGARDGGFLGVPCLHLLEPLLPRRMAALESFASSFDLSRPERNDVFKRLAGISDPVERMHQLQICLDNSASWFYRHLQQQLADRRLKRSLTFSISELLPESADSLRRHLRLEPPPGTEAEPSWTDAISILLTDEGIEETVLRLSCLPMRLPESLVVEISALSSAERALLLKSLSERLQSPLQRIQFLSLAVKFKSEFPDAIAQAKSDVSNLLAPQQGVVAMKILVTLFKWTHLRLSWLVEARRWSAATRLRCAWVHASRVCSALASSGSMQIELEEWIANNCQEISADAIGLSPELARDAASPVGLDAEALLFAALADFAAQLSEADTINLDLTSLFKLTIPEGKRFPVLLKIWHDPTLRNNALNSYLGQNNHVGLRRLLGDETCQYLQDLPALNHCEQALDELEVNPHDPSKWLILLLATNAAPLPTILAEKLDHVIQKVRLAESLKRDVLEAERLIVLTTDFATRGRPSSLIDGLFKQLLEVTLVASTTFQSNSIAAGSESNGSKIAAVCLEGTWRCSLVSGDEQATIRKFADNLSQLMSRWPSLARRAHAQVMEVAARMPLSHQEVFWRIALTCRAWL